MQTDSVGNGEPLKVSEQGRDTGSTSHLRTSCLAEGLKGLVVCMGCYKICCGAPVVKMRT